MAKRDGMTIGELEKKSGIRRSTIHHYIWYGLLHQPFRTGQTMAYYDRSHLRRLETIQKIKVDFLKSAKTSRVPLDLIKHKLTEDYTLTKGKSAAGKEAKGKNMEKVQKKKEEIIEATLRLYADRGYYLTNIREIAGEVGISAPTFYHYFKDKRELFVEAVEYVIKNYRQESKTALEKEKDPARRSILMFRIFQKHYPKIGEILNQLRAGVVIGDQWARERLSRVYKEMTETVAGQVRQGIKLGLIRNVNPELHGFVSVFLDEMAIHLASLDKRFSINQVMVFVADMLYHAFLTEKGKKVFGSFERFRS
ncbi:MAG: TetR family transcriptional regulator [Deltaproteobacteria bacterium]|nr:TetR family transcriptional regulator [Deltaproteobacteria bacterium]